MVSFFERNVERTVNELSSVNTLSSLESEKIGCKMKHEEKYVYDEMGNTFKNNFSNTNSSSIAYLLECKKPKIVQSTFSQQGAYNLPLGPFFILEVLELLIRVRVSHKCQSKFSQNSSSFREGN